MTDVEQTESFPSDGDLFLPQLVEHLGVPLVATDEKLLIRLWNAAASRLFGARAEQMIGEPVVTVMPEHRREAAERVLRRAIDHGEISEVEFQYSDRHGGRRELIVDISPIVIGSGQRVGAAAAFRDITHRIKLQAELLETRKMASLGEMAGAMSHHFNNILGGIITSVDYARQSEDPALQRRILDLIGDSLARATTLLKGLLDFAEGDQRADEAWDFRRIVDGLAEEVRPHAQRQGIDFILEMPEMPELPMPCAKVTTVLRNVVQNAIDAMPDGGTLRITVTFDANWVLTRVEDTGCGLDEAALSRVFEPFWSTKGALGEGTGQARGLGLAVAHGILHVLGGSISASSEPDKGSCFIISLPRKEWNSCLGKRRNVKTSKRLNQEREVSAV